MKSYSGAGIFDPISAKSRRKKSDWEIRALMSPAYMLPNGSWQADQNIEDCRKMAALLETNRVRYFVGSMEEWYDGKPEIFEAL